MMDGDSHTDGPGHVPTWWRTVGIMLMLPIGIIVAFLLIIFFGFDRTQHPGELLFILLAVFIFMFFVRMMFRRSRRRYWRQQRAQNAPMRILRERYARGEITKEQFEEMSRELRPHR